MAARDFEVLDGIRGVAALAVAATHASVIFGFDPAPRAYLAVDLFFVLSGFVLSHAYDHRGIGVASFARLRAIRLYPLYAAGTSLGLLSLVALAVYGRSTDGLAAAPFALIGSPSPMTPTLYPLNPPAWSLFFEFAINILYATAVFRSRFALAVLMTGSLAALALAKQQQVLGFGWDWSHMWVGAARVGWSFSAGVLLRRYAPRVGAPRWVALLVLAATAAVMLIPHVENSDAVDLAFIVAGAPLLVWVGSCSEPGPGVRGACSALGIASYALYAIHYPLLLPANTIAKHLGVPGLLAGVGFLAVTSITAYMLTLKADAPARDWLAKLGRRRSQGSLAPTR